MYVTELSSSVTTTNKQLNNSRSLPRHFKLNSQQQAQNYYDVKDTLYVTKSIVIIMQLPYVTAACKFLTALHRFVFPGNILTNVLNLIIQVIIIFRYAMTKPKVPGQLSVESYIYHFLYEIPLPLPGKPML